MMRHLDTARLELRLALEDHQGASELDAATRLILEAVRAITAARREALRDDGAEDHRGGDRLPDRPELKVVRSGTTETNRIARGGGLPMKLMGIDPSLAGSEVSVRTLAASIAARGPAS
jgi:hypothetical protein